MLSCGRLPFLRPALLHQTNERAWTAVFASLWRCSCLRVFYSSFLWFPAVDGLRRRGDEGGAVSPPNQPTPIPMPLQQQRSLPQVAATLSAADATAAAEPPSPDGPPPPSPERATAPDAAAAGPGPGLGPGSAASAPRYEVSAPAAAAAGLPAAPPAKAAGAPGAPRVSGGSAFSIPPKRLGLAPSPIRPPELGFGTGLGAIGGIGGAGGVGGAAGAATAALLLQLQLQQQQQLQLLQQQMPAPQPALPPLPLQPPALQLVQPPRQYAPRPLSPGRLAYRSALHAEEARRYAAPEEPFLYTAIDGASVPVCPLRNRDGRGVWKPREHVLLRHGRPPAVSVLSLVRDALARVPEGKGTKADVVALVRDSQWCVSADEGVPDTILLTAVGGALDRLASETDPCAAFDRRAKRTCVLPRELGDVGPSCALIGYVLYLFTQVPADACAPALDSRLSSRCGRVVLQEQPAMDVPTPRPSARDTGGGVRPDTRGAGGGRAGEGQRGSRRGSDPCRNDICRCSGGGRGIGDDARFCGQPARGGRGGGGGGQSSRVRTAALSSRRNRDMH